MLNPDEPLISPCIRHCCLTEEDICLGCFRSLDEITGWSEASHDEKKSILSRTEQRRAAHEQKPVPQ